MAVVRADKRRATFGAQYWRRWGQPDPDQITLKNLSALIDAVAAEFATLQVPMQRAAQWMAESLERASHRSHYVLSDDPEWYDEPNPWDAQTVTYGDTMQRIDHTLDLYEGRDADV